MPLSDPRMSAGAILLQANISNVGGANTAFFASPEAGYVKELHAVRSGAGGAGNSVLTVTTAAGAIGNTLTMATGGAGGDVDSLELSKYDTNNVIAAGEGISVASDGGFAGTPGAEVMLVVEPF